MIRPGRLAADLMVAEAVVRTARAQRRAARGCRDRAAAMLFEDRARRARMRATLAEIDACRGGLGLTAGSSW